MPHLDTYLKSSVLSFTRILALLKGHPPFGFTLFTRAYLFSEIVRMFPMKYLQLRVILAS